MLDRGRKTAGRRLAADQQRGFSLIELIITLGILAIMVSAAIPMARSGSKKVKEQQLRRSLQEIREGIDRYHSFCLAGLVGPLDRKPNDEYYPPTLEVLVDGVIPPNSTKKIRFLIRIPEDPITGKAEWGLRSVQDDADAGSWGGQNVYDVYSKSDGKALDGTKYKDW